MKFEYDKERDIAKVLLQGDDLQTAYREAMEYLLSERVCPKNTPAIWNLTEINLSDLTPDRIKSVADYQANTVQADRIAPAAILVDREMGMMIFKLYRDMAGISEDRLGICTTEDEALAFISEARKKYS